MTPCEFQCHGGTQVIFTATLKTKAVMITYHQQQWMMPHNTLLVTENYTTTGKSYNFLYFAQVQAAGISQACMLFTASTTLVSFLLQTVPLIASRVNVCTVFSPLKPLNAVPVHSDFLRCKLGTVLAHHSWCAHIKQKCNTALVHH